MITGYNTDVRHNDVVFHVQTEDKGSGNPFIESLVYVGGQVLASKRASYATLLAEGQDEKAIVAVMDHQHRTMIAAIRHGKFDEKLVALASFAANRAAGPQAVAAPSLVPPPAAEAPALAAMPAAVAGALPGQRPVPAPAAVETDRGPERSLDQVILEYLTNEADQEQLLLTLERDQDLGLGRQALVALRASSSKSGLPVPGAQVTVKMISTVSEPRTLAVGQSDEGGGLQLAFDIPALVRGTAALIITAVSPIGRAELKQLL